MASARVAVFRLLINLIRYNKGEEGGRPDRDIARIEIIESEVFPISFKYKAEVCAEDYYLECLSMFEYDYVSDVLDGLGEGIYELHGDFHYSSQQDYWGEWDEDYYVDSVNVRALTEKDIRIYCPEEYHDIKAAAEIKPAEDDQGLLLKNLE